MKLLLFFSKINILNICFVCLQIMNWRDNLSIPKVAELSKEADNLIRGLICDQGDRLGSRNGSEDIKRHPFFTVRISYLCFQYP